MGRGVGVGVTCVGGGVVFIVVAAGSWAWCGDMVLLSLPVL
jgi:hypothetical protein